MNVPLETLEFTRKLGLNYDQEILTFDLCAKITEQPARMADSDTDLNTGLPDKDFKEEMLRMRAQSRQTVTHVASGPLRHAQINHFI